MTNTIKQGLVKKQTWTDEELAEFAALLETCNTYEGLNIKLGSAMLRSRPGNETNDFLYYENGKLVGILAFDDMGDEDREMTGMVHPEHRRKGIFTALLTAATAEAQQRGIQRLIFVCERFSRSGQAFIAAIGAQYDFSELGMVLDEFNEKGFFQDRLQLQKAGPDDIQAVARVISTAFGQSEEGAAKHVAKAIHNPHAQYYIARLGEEPVGSLNLFRDTNTYGIYAFGILPQYRRRGFGRQMLEQIIHTVRAESQNPIELQVETENTNAIGLYRSCGFKEVTTYGYYTLDVN